MGKVNKRQPLKNSNHHDNPHRTRKTVVRRQHSQKSLGKSNTSTGGKQLSPKTSYQTTNDAQQKALKVPFSKWDRVLLVGEGDFSFTLSLCKDHAISSIISSCLDTKDLLLQKYPGVRRTIQQIGGLNISIAEAISHNDKKGTDRIDSEEEGMGFSTPASDDDSGNNRNSAESAKSFANTVIHYAIDATKLSTVHRKTLKKHSPFTKIVFNFPHVGGLSTDVNRQVRSNQELLVNFFNSAKPLLATSVSPAQPFTFVDDDADTYDYDSDVENRKTEHLKHGQILVTLFEGEPYTLWNIRDLARHSGLKVLESFKFPWSTYPNYRHARTIGDITTGKDRSDDGKRKGAWRGEERDARCYVLALKDDNDGRPLPGSRKRRQPDNDSD